jgi:hypothetical protein
LFVVLKAHAVESQKLKNWDQKLVLVPDIQIVQGPQGVITSVIGFYAVQKEIVDTTGNLLIFQSGINGVYKSIPCVSNWEPRPLGGLDNHSVVKQVESASEVMQDISDNESGIVEGKWRFINIEPKEIGSLPNISIDADGVKLGTGKLGEETVNVIDVLLGPLNLQA